VQQRLAQSGQLETSAQSEDAEKMRRESEDKSMQAPATVVQKPAAQGRQIYLKDKLHWKAK
jgi:hypothetical protein